MPGRKWPLSFVKFISMLLRMYWSHETDTLEGGSWSTKNFNVMKSTCSLVCVTKICYRDNLCTDINAGFSQTDYKSVGQHCLSMTKQHRALTDIFDKFGFLPGSECQYLPMKNVKHMSLQF